MHIRPAIVPAALGACVLGAAALPASSSAQQLYDFGTAFGRAAAASGPDILVGEPHNVVRPGRVYVFRSGGGALERAEVLTASDGERSDHFGRAIAATADAALVGAPRARGGAGAAYLFIRTARGWSEVEAMAPAEGVSAMGSAVAVSDAWAAVTVQVGERERIRIWTRSADGTLGGEV